MTEMLNEGNFVAVKRYLLIYLLCLLFSQKIYTTQWHIAYLATYLTPSLLHLILCAELSFSEDGSFYGDSGSYNSVLEHKPRRFPGWRFCGVLAVMGRSRPAV